MRRKTKWQRYAERWHEQLDKALGEHKLFRENAASVLASHLADVRRKDATLVANSVTIQELQDQVAMQHKHNSNAMQDASDAIVRHNRMVQLVRDLREHINLLEDRESKLKSWIKSRGLRGPYVKR